MNIQKYVSKHLNAILLSPSQEGIIPGAVLDITWENQVAFIFKKIFTLGIYQKKYKINVLNGYAWDIFDADEFLFGNQVNTGNIATETISGSVNVANVLSLPQYGLNVSSEFANIEHSKFHIEQVKVRVLIDASLTYNVFNKFKQQEQINPTLYSWLYKDLLVTECYYATKVIWEFNRELDVDLLLEYVKTTTVSDQLHIKRVSTQVIEIAGQPNVPFAVKGIWLK